MAFLYYVCLCIFLSGIKFEAHAQDPPCPTPGLTTECVGCQQSIFCSTGVASFCTGGKVCKQQGTRAACVTPTSTSECQCSGGPTSGVTFQCDPYNNITFISCFNGVIQSSGNCTVAGQTCNPSNGMCEASVSPPTEMTTPTVPTCPPNPDGRPMKYNCTALFFCNAGEMQIYSCAPGQIYSESAENCVQYGTEYGGCGPEDDGLFADPFDCQKYYSCFSNPDFEDGEETCPPNFHFDSPTSQCIADSADAPCEVETCTPCLQPGDVFPANNAQCSQTYYKCVNTTYAEEGSCPPTFMFDNSKEYCTRACPSP